MTENETTSRPSVRSINRTFAVRQLRAASVRFADAASDLTVAADRIERDTALASVADTAGWAVDHAMWTIANASLGSVVIAAAQADVPDAAGKEMSGR